MVREAEAHADADKNRKELIEAKNEADTSSTAPIRTSPSTRPTSPRRLSTPSRRRRWIQTAVESENLEQVREKINELQQAVMKIGEALNKGAAGGAGPEEPKAEDAGEEGEKKSEEPKQ